MISRDELMHHRIQAWMRENKCMDLKYLGKRPDIITGVLTHYYRIGSHEVSVDCIHDDFELLND